MILNGFRVKGKNLSEDFQNNLLPAYPDMQNMNNWNIVGDVSISYTNEVNILEYFSIGDYDKIKHYASEWGYTPSEAFYTAIDDYWSQHQDCNAMVYVQSNNQFVVVIATQWVKDPNMTWQWNSTAPSKYVSYNPSNDSVYNEAPFNRDYEWDLKYAMQNNKIIKIENYLDAQIYEKYIQLSLTADTSKLYLVKFKACSPSGFTNGSSSNVVIICGSNITNGNISNVASNNLAEYEYIVNTDSNGTINLKFDLEQMTSSSAITLKLSDFGIYHI